MQLRPLHHVTCVCSSAPRTAEFYRGLGFRLVKKTVNFDDPTSYHLYFGDERGSPGTLITFFEWPAAAASRPGLGTLETIALTVPGLEGPERVEDPDGLALELVPGERNGLDHVVAFGNPDLYAGLVAGDAPIRFAFAEDAAVIGIGTAHHLAWCCGGRDEQEAWRRRLAELGLQSTEILDRKYFSSIYFRMPDGLLIEIATEEPGFAVDEPEASLGGSLSLPGWLEQERERLEAELAPIG